MHTFFAEQEPKSIDISQFASTPFHIKTSSRWLRCKCAFQAAFYVQKAAAANTPKILLMNNRLPFVIMCAVDVTRLLTHPPSVVSSGARDFPF
jgi:hypothetical protein